MKKRILKGGHWPLNWLPLITFLAIAALAWDFTEQAAGGFTPWMTTGTAFSWLQFSVVIGLELWVAIWLLRERTTIQLLPASQGEPAQSTEESAASNAAEKEIHDLPQNFNAWLSRPFQFFFKYCYLFCVILYAVEALQILFFSLHAGSHIRDIPHYDLTWISLRQLQLIIVGTGVVLGAYHVWRLQIPKILTYFYNGKRLKGDNWERDFLEFLREIRATLRKRRWHLIPISLVVLYGAYYYYDVWLLGKTDYIYKNADNLPFVISFYIHMACVALIVPSCMYCLGLISSILYITGRLISSVAQRFKFNVEPLHPDRCGGFAVLGNLCFNTAMPIFMGVAFFTGYLFFSVLNPRNGSDKLTVAFTLFIIVAYGLLVSIFVLIVPLWHIHKAMQREREIDNEDYAAAMGDFRRKIRKQLENGQTAEARRLKEEMDLRQVLHVTYPQWPFDVGSSFLSGILTIGTSLLAGFFTAFMQPLVQTLLSSIKP